MISQMMHESLRLQKGEGLFGSTENTGLRECQIYRYRDNTGEALSSAYRVFPGVQLVYNDVHLGYGHPEAPSNGDILEIRHCREGRMEWDDNGAFFYLSPGDLSVTRTRGESRAFYYPLNHYHGISVLIDLKRAPDCFSCFLSDVDVRLSELTDKYCGEEGFYIARSKPYIEHIFSELYSVPDHIRKGYFKVKVLELLLSLSGAEPENERGARPACSQSQSALAKEVCDYLTQNMEQRITLDQLSRRFHISGTQIKNAFRDVYGISIYSYIRTRKMESAALMLAHTDRSVMDIAGSCGYTNQSKFSAAFKTIMGKTPLEYRNAERAENARLEQKHSFSE